jgi:hypothetical protein
LATGRPELAQPFHRATILVVASVLSFAWIALAAAETVNVKYRGPVGAPSWTPLAGGFCGTQLDIDLDVQSRSAEIS